MEEIIRILKEVRPDLDFDTQTGLIENGLLDSLDLVNLV